MNAIALLYQLKAQKIELWLKNDDQLAFSFDKAIGFPDALKQAVKAQKTSLLSILSHNAISTEALAKSTAYYQVPDNLMNHRLRSIQQGMYLQSCIDDDRATYTIPLFYRLKNCDHVVLSEAIHALLEQNRILRMSIDEKLDFHFLPASQFQIELGEIRDGAVSEYCQSESMRTFPSQTGQFIHISLYRIADTDETLLNLSHHHMLTEAFSVELIIQELDTLYQQIAAGNADVVTPRRLDYFDYLAHSDYSIETEGYQSAIASLSQSLASTEPLRLMREPAVDNAAGHLHFRFEQATLERLKALSLSAETSIYALLLTCLTRVLDGYCGEPGQFPMGLTVANRPSEFDRSIGPFISTLPLITPYQIEDSLLQNCQAIHRAIAFLNEHNHLNLNMLGDAFEGHKDDLADVIDVLFTFHNFSKANCSPQALAYQRIAMPDAFEKFGISLTASQHDTHIDCVVTYLKSSFEKGYITAIFESFTTIVQSLQASALARPIHELSLFSDDTPPRQWAYNQTQAPFDEQRCLHQLFEQQVLRTPDHIALITENGTLTYQALNQAANQLAQYLMTECQLVVGDLVGVYCDRSEQMMISLYAILKCGAAYVPIDPEYPSLRTQAILEDSGLRCVITQQQYQAVLSQFDLPHCLIIDAPSTAQRIAEQADNNPDISMSSDQLAYVIYTSGTTGKPKGVMLPHRGIVNRIQWMNTRYPLTHSDVLIQKTPYVFDVSVWELFWAHWYGASLVMPAPGAHKDPALLSELICAHQVSVIHFVPSMLDAFLQHYKHDLIPLSLRLLFCSGEALKLSQAQLAHQLLPKCEIHNLYGPTEASIDVLAYDCAEQDYQRVTIGKPIANTTAYVVDSRCQALPRFAIGELLIGGVGLARGYLNREALTQEKFIANPFEPNTRLYKTGDRVRRLADDNIEYLERCDFQVKLRGFRIELGEIESVLAEFPGITQSLAIVQDNHLIAYYTSDVVVDEVALLDFLSNRLTHYMVPHYLMPLTTFPTTLNGKLNRKALPMPSVRDDQPRVAPQTQAETKLLSLMAGVLSLDDDQLSMTDDFFRVGGDSILSIQLVGQVKQAFQAAISVKDIFQLRTAARLADFIAHQDQAHHQSQAIQSEQSILTGTLPLLPIQDWFFEQDFEHAGHWNQAFMMLMPAAVKPEKLTVALSALAEQHDALRLRFQRTAKGDIQQQYQADVTPIPFHTFDRQGIDDSALADKMTQWQADFDIAHGPIARAVLITGYDDNRDRLFFACHHLAIDTVSWHILARDLRRLYEGQSLPAKGSSYRQWSDGIQRYAQGHADDARHWQAVTDAVAKSNHALAQHRDASNDLIESEFTLSPELTQLFLTEANHAFHTDSIELLLTALSSALSDLSGTSAPVIAIEGHGRDHIEASLDVSSTVGWFTSLYPILLKHQPGLADCIQSIKSHYRQTPHHGLTYGPLIGYQQQALPTVLFNYLGKIDNSTPTSAWQIMNEPVGCCMKMSCHPDVMLNGLAYISDKQLTIKLSSRCQPEKTSKLLSALHASLTEIIRYCAAQPAMPYCDADLLSVQSESDLPRFPLIPKANKTDWFQMTEIQKAYLLGRLGNHEIGNTANHVYSEYYYDDLDVARLESVLQQVVNDHPVLRTQFSFQSLQQRYVPVDQLEPLSIQVNRFKTALNDSDLRTVRERLSHQVYDPESFPLFAFEVSHFKDKTVLHISFDLILLDVQSRMALFSEIDKRYRNAAYQPSQPAISFKDYQDYHSLLRHSKWYQTDKAYWQSKLESMPLRPSLQFEMPAEDIIYPEFLEHTLFIDKATWQAFKAKVDAAQLSISAVLLALYGNVISYFSGQSEFLITLTLFNRYPIHPDVAKVLGDFTSTNLFHFKDYGKAITKTLERTHERLFEDIQHAFYPGLQVQRDLSRFHQLDSHKAVSPIIFTSVIGNKSHDFDSHAFLSDSESLAERYWTGQTSQAWIDLQAVETGDCFMSKWLYVSQLFSKSTIETFNKLFCALIECLAKEDWQAITQLPSYCPQRDLTIINAANQTNTPFEPDTLFAAYERSIQSLSAGQCTAVIDVEKDQQISHQQLIRQSDLLARLLVEQNQDAPLIGILSEKGYNQVISAFAIMKSGHAYLPLHVDWPVNRLDEVLEQGGAAICFISEAIYAQAEIRQPLEKKYKLLVIEHCLAHIEERQATLKTLSLPTVTPDDVAYVIFTSGSTGKPKGVTISHAGALNTLHAVNARFDVSQRDRVLALSELSFDLSVYDIFGVLMVGGSLVYPVQAKTKDPEHWAELISQYHVTLWNTVPQLAGLLCDIAPSKTLASLRVYCLSGDWIPTALPDKLKAASPDATVMSLGGATEGSIWSIWYEIDKVNPDWRSIPYGSAMPNQTMTVLNEHLEHCPIGVPGEIHIGGAGVALNYWRDEALTAARYIEHPSLGRLYKTGDLGRWHAEGYIEFLGRLDFQVKLHGYRVELEEIETTLMRDDAIEQAIVQVQDQQLVAYYLSEHPLDESQLTKQVELSLPHYMVPGVFIHLDAIPLTPNGKVNLKALPKVDFSRQHSADALKTPWQKKLAGAFAAVLKVDVDHIGIEDDFFRLGGDSISAIQMVSYLRQQLHCDVNITQVFSYRTVEALAAHLESSEPTQKKTAVSQSMIAGESALLPIQSWFFEQDFAKPGHWNQAFFIKTPKLDRKKLEAAIQRVVEAHAIFRCRFRRDAITGQYQAWYLEQAAELRLSTYSASHLDECQDQLTQWQSEFDLENGPLYHFAYIDGVDDHGRVFIACHHLLIDTVSWHILCRDLQLAYEDQPIQTSTLTYHDWGQALAQYSERHASQITHWQSMQDKALRFAYSDYGDEWHQSRIQLSAAQTEQWLQGIHTVLNTQPYEVLLAALNDALLALTENEQVTILVEGHGREAADTGLDPSDTVGWFTSLFPVTFQRMTTVLESVRYVKDHYRQLPDKGMGYGALMGYAHDELPELTFNYLGQIDAGGSHSDWQITQEPAGCQSDTNNHFKHPVSLVAFVKNGQLTIECSSLLSTTITQRLMQQINTALQDVINTLTEQSRSYLTLSDIAHLISQSQLTHIQAEREVEAIYPANSLQQGFIFHSLNHAAYDDAYRVQIHWQYHSAIDASCLKQAWQLTQASFPALRTRFDYEEELLQIIDKQGTLAWHEIDLSTLQDKAEQDKAFAALREDDRLKAYDLSQAPLFRVYLIKHEADKFSCILNIHHAINDGWSSPILLECVHRHYADLMNDKPIRLKVDRAFDEAQCYLRDHAGQDDAYWQEQISTIKERSDLSGLVHADKRDQPLQLISHIDDQQSEKITLHGENFQALSKLAAHYGVTLNSILQFVWHEVLHVYGGSQQTVVGSIVSGRHLPVAQIENSVGLYINTLPSIFDHAQPDRSIIACIRLCQQTINQMNEHSNVHLSTLSTAQGRLFDSLFMFENYPDMAGSEYQQQLGLTIIDSVEKRDYPLAVVIDAHSHHLNIQIDYAAELFGRSAIVRVLDLMSHLITQIITHPERMVSDLSLITASQTAQLSILNEAKQTQARHATWLQAFEQQVSATPHAIAIQDTNTQMTYQALNEKANQLARLMQAKGVAQNQIVAIMLAKQNAWLIACLATLKCGAAYVPIDLKTPNERRDTILEDCAARVLIMESATGRHQSHTQTLGLFDSDTQAAMAKQSTENLDTVVTANDLMYVLYTSGSTGQPKGVMIAHHAYIQTLCSFKAAHFAKHDTLSTYSMTNVVFDIFGLEYGLPLMTGGCVTLGDAYFDQIDARPYDFIQMTPSVCETALPRITANEHTVLLLGGESLSLSLLQQALSAFPRVINVYGPTETTIWSTTKCYNRADLKTIQSLSIGRALPNERVFILGHGDKILPIGATGELAIGGETLALGYLGQAALTQARFIEIETETGSERVYKTGDLVRVNDENELEFLGRSDFQIKLHGHRIELGEIESRLQSLPDIKQAVVLAMPLREDDPGSSAIVAYLVAHADIDTKHIRHQLEASLPSYMIPADFIVLEHFPLNANGKLDRKALPRPSVRKAQVIHQTTSALIDELSAIWCSVLNVDAVGLEDNFFDLGGNSVLLIKLFNQLPASIKSQIKMVDIFKYPSIAQLANALKVDKSPQSIRQASIVSRDEEIAIIGMAGRFPGADDLATFWKNLKSGQPAVEFYSDEVLAKAGVDADLLSDPNYIKAQSKLSDIQCFDADFFDISAGEAQIMDPQQRLFMACVWHALEDATYPPGSTDSVIGLYAGCGQNHYVRDHILPNLASDDLSTQYQIMIHNQANYLCTKVAYKLNLTGPAITLQTGCSTSLVAVHQACLALRSGDCEMAVAGGVSIGQLEQQGYLYQEGMIFSKDGYCRPFDAKANGTIEGQGVAAVVLKPLSKAIVDGDLIYAVIKASAINNDGHQKIGFTAPSPIKQAEVIQKTIDKAGIDAASITYIEAHGTGTPLGDPIEIQALKEVFAQSSNACAIGALKSQIGHLDVAAGIAGLIKTALSVHHQCLTPTAHFESLNPTIDLGDSPFYINTQTKSWQASTGPLRAGVSSFGIGGTNAHVILEQAPTVHAVTAKSKTKRHLIQLSAKSKTALQAKVRDLAEFCQQAGVDLQTLSRNLLNQAKMDWSTTYVASDVSSLCHELSAETQAMRQADKTRPIIFVFPGQGAQHPEMLSALYDNDLAFQETVDACLSVLNPKINTRLTAESILRPGARVHDTDLTQPCLFILEYALARYLMRLGLQPAAMLGHSIGEYAAACLSGVISLEDALELIVERGRLSFACEPGAMLAVKLSEEDVAPYLSNMSVSIAAVNLDDACVLSGPCEQIETVSAQMKKDDVIHKRLSVTRAFHSAMVEPILAEFENTLNSKSFKTPTIPIMSTLQADWMSEAMTPNYWLAHCRQPVQFSKALRKLRQHPNYQDALLIEVGPGHVLTSLIKQQDESAKTLAMMPLRKAESNGHIDVLQALGQLAADGYPIDWAAYFGQSEYQKMRLPLYPFDQKRHWFEKVGVTKNAVEKKAHSVQETVAESIEARVCHEWNAVLGGEISDYQLDFFDCGGDSLLAVRLQHKLKKVFSVPVELMSLERASIQAIADSIKSHGQPSSSQSHIIKIKQGTDAEHPPLVLIHPIGGDIFFYHQLAKKLKPEQTVYAIRSPLLSGEAQFDSIEAMADAYLAELKRAGIALPFTLGGSSFGGIVAYQMAQKIRECEQVSPPVVLIDSPAYGNLPNAMSQQEILSYLCRYGLGQITMDPEHLMSVGDVEAQITYLAKQAEGTDMADMLSSDFLPSFIKTWQRHTVAMQRYIPMPYDGPILFFSHSEVIPEFPAAQSACWRKLALADFSDVLVPGNHISMNMSPNVDIIASTLNHYEFTTIEG